MSTLGQRVATAREALGISQADLASRVGMTQQGIGAIESGLSERPKKLRELARVLRVSESELLGESDAGDEPHYAPDDVPPPDFDPDADESGAGLIDGLVIFQGKVPGSQPEVASKSGAGPGQMLDTGGARVRSNGIATGHPVVAEWVIPPSFLRYGLGGTPVTAIIVQVIGHSMEPRLVDGDRVIVDISQNTWIADAIYVIDDGDAQFQVKTIKKVTSSSPPIFRIVSENPPGDEVQRRHDEFRIVGRVVGRISRP